MWLYRLLAERAGFIAHSSATRLKNAKFATVVGSRRLFKRRGDSGDNPLSQKSQKHRVTRCHIVCCKRSQSCGVTVRAIAPVSLWLPLLARDLLTHLTHDAKPGNQKRSRTPEHPVRSTVWCKRQHFTISKENRLLGAALHTAAPRRPMKVACSSPQRPMRFKPRPAPVEPSTYPLTCAGCKQQR